MRAGPEAEGGGSTSARPMRLRISRSPLVATWNRARVNSGWRRSTEQEVPSEPPGRLKLAAEPAGDVRPGVHAGPQRRRLGAAARAAPDDPRAGPRCPAATRPPAAARAAG